MSGHSKRGSPSQDQENAEWTDKKQKKPKLMQDSGQTEEERRQIRREQRDLMERIVENAHEIADINSDTFANLTSENHEIFTKVRYVREAVEDMQNVKGLANNAAKQSGAVSVSSSYDSARFIEELRKRGLNKRTGNFDWVRYGRAVGGLFRPVPAISFMLGPLDKPVKAAKPDKPKTVKKKATGMGELTAEVHPEVVGPDQQKGRAHKDATQARIAKMKAALLRAGAHHEPLDFVEALLDPESFTQTVENMFDFSFMVKNAAGGVAVDSATGLPQLHCKPVPEGVPRQRQMVTSFSMKDWRELKEAYELKTCHVPHRPTGAGTDYFDPLVDKVAAAAAAARGSGRGGGSRSSAGE